jgi:hypothetical protein
MRAHLAIVCLAIGCGSHPTPGSTEASASRDAATDPVSFAGVVTAPATVGSSAELTAHLVIRNPGPDALALTRGAVDLAVLALEVRDAHDQRVPTMPPPVPRPEDAEQIVLAPGETLERDFRLDVFSPPLPPGTYALHCRVVTCAPWRFTVAP